MTFLYKHLSVSKFAEMRRLDISFFKKYSVKVNKGLLVSFLKHRTPRLEVVKAKSMGDILFLFSYFYKHDFATWKTVRLV
jgi:hypothetical protein